MAFGAILTKCGKTDARDYTAAAATEEPEVEEDSTFAISREVYFNWDYNEKMYFKVNGNFSKSDPLIKISLLNFPLNGLPYTVELVLNSPLTQELTVFLTGDNGVPYDRFILLAGDVNGYVTSSDTFISGLAITSYDSFTDIDLDFTLYFYVGSYVPGYGQGLAAGIQQGYQDGLIEGTSQAKYGIFNKATVTAYLGFYDVTGSNEDYYETFNNLIPNYISNGVDFTPIASKYEIYTPSNGHTYYLESADITVNFATPFVYNKNSPFLLKGDVSLVDMIKFTDINNKNYFAEFKYNSNNPNIAEFPADSQIQNAAPIKSVNLFFGRASDTLRGAMLTQDNGNYYAGYESGYNDGLEQGKGNGYDAGYNTGYDKGITEGKAEGYAQAIAEGVSQEGIFNGALAFIRTFFQLTTQLLKTKIVGDIDFGLIIIGLPAVGMLANLVMGFVKKHLGGRGADD